MNNLRNIEKDLKSLENKEKALHHLRFFRTGMGEYGEGDKFLGITVPEQRKIAKKYPDINLNELQVLLRNDYHEFRLTALIILVDKYKKAKFDQDKQDLINFYLKNTKHINNWDLVDLSAEILGQHYGESKPEIILKLSKSSDLWEQRISIIATYYLIKKNNFNLTLEIALILVNHKHDLIHKAVGWMLREVGKRDLNTELEFLDQNYKNMPRTMLRYAIEKFPEEPRLHYLKR
jgi:3-methyladenine DNA glycosylase AlkD